MRALGPALRRVIWIIITLLIMPGGILAQDAGDSDQAYKFSKEELTQMLAPIALYPDALTAQVLMASTYPLEVVEADRWRSQNRQLQEKDLETALQDKNWDPSVKSLCHFPDILKSMSDKLDQTRKLGDAFLGQEEEGSGYSQVDQRTEGARREWKYHNRTGQSGGHLCAGLRSGLCVRPVVVSRLSPLLRVLSARVLWRSILQFRPRNLFRIQCLPMGLVRLVVSSSSHRHQQDQKFPQLPRQTQ